METFNLSDKAVKDLSNNPIPNYYWEQDIKEFIRLLKECKGCKHDGSYIAIGDLQDFIDKLAGEKLI